VLLGYFLFLSWGGGVCGLSPLLLVALAGHLCLGEPGGGVEPESYLVHLVPDKTLCDQSLENPGLRDAVPPESYLRC
jgi:hypothetical protein